MNAFILEHIDTVATIIISVIGGIFYLYNNKKTKFFGVNKVTNIFRQNWVKMQIMKR